VLIRLLLPLLFISSTSCICATSSTCSSSSDCLPITYPVHYTQVLRVTTHGGLPVQPAAEAGLLLAAWRRYHAASCPEGLEIVLVGREQICNIKFYALQRNSIETHVFFRALTWLSP
jgi:hypothetical protein